MCVWHHVHMCMHACRGACNAWLGALTIVCLADTSASNTKMGTSVMLSIEIAARSDSRRRLVLAVCLSGREKGSDFGGRC